MTNNDFYHQLLGLSAPWTVVSVELDVSSQEVRVFVEHDHSPLLCPECAQPGLGYDAREERRWRHLDTCQFKTFLIARTPRVRCPTHGVKTVRASWCEPRSRFTLAFECFAIAVLRAAGVQAKAAQLLRIGAGQTHDIMERAVVRGLSRRDRNEIIPEVSLDEKSFHKGHSYITVLGDSRGKRILDLVESRTLHATENLLRQGLSPSQQEQVASVSMDMWPAFAAAKDQVLPWAQTVHDRFHVAGYLNGAVDQTRREEHKKLLKIGDLTLSRSKWCWLRSPENLTDKQRGLFGVLQSQDLETAKVWAFKEAFREFFGAGSVSEGEAFFSNWYEQALTLGNKHLTKVAKMLQDHLPGLLAYLQHHTSNAIAEGLNGQIQLIKARSRGFRRFQNFRIAILFFLGKLELNPQGIS